MEKIIEFKNVTKTFLSGSVIANKNISFSVEKGTIHAIAGENGAGKSTLLSMLFGLYSITSGQINIRGKQINYKSAADAMEDKMGMVQQHFQLIDKFTVGENILLGQERTKFGFKFFKKSYKKIDELAKKYNFNISSKMKIKNLSVSQEQKTEILKLLYSDAEILLFDEPSAMLAPQEIDELIKIIKKLKKMGKTIIIVTHKLNEIRALADYVTVIRQGAYIGTLSARDLTAKKLSTMMVGRQVTDVKRKSQIAGGIKLKVDSLVIKKHRKMVVNHASFDLKAGEILAIAGVEGNGQIELVNAILGMEKINSGAISIMNGNNNEIINTWSISQRNEYIASISEDRQKYGLVLDLPIYENIALKNFWKSYTKFGFLNRKAMHMDGLSILQKYHVIGANGGTLLMQNLSGGNQQKVVVGREIEAQKDIIIIFQATRGLDVGAIEYIHEQILQARDDGKAILLISYDIDEILTLADRVLVMNNGSITGEIFGEQLNKEKIGILMSSDRSKNV